jgi:hypothetical protein
LTLAEKVSVLTSTSSPGPTPASSSARCSAAVPEESAAACPRADQLAELPLEGVHVRAERRDPVGREGIGDELLLRSMDVVAGSEEMARVEPVAGPAAHTAGDMPEDQGNLGGRAAERAAGAGRVFHEQARLAAARLERRRHRHGDPGRCRLDIAVRGRARMEADGADAERGRALHLLGQSGRGALPFGRISGRHAQHVGAVDQDVARVHAGLVQRPAEPRHTFGPDRGLVTVELRDRREDLARELVE